MKKKIFGIVLLCIVAGVIGSMIWGTSHLDKEDVEKIKTQEYSAVFFSMYDISHFAEEDFAHYRGLQTIKLQSEIGSFKELSKCVGLVLESPQSVNTVYMGIDPVQLWKKSSGKEQKWLENMTKYLGTVIEQNPDISFEILLPSPYISYWLDMEEEKVEESLTVYQRTVDFLSQYDNVWLFFAGQEEWLNGNHLNYEGDALAVNAGIASHFVPACFCDRKYVVDTESMQDALQQLRAEIDREKSAPTQYGDLSEWSIVFLGDSIIGLETTTSSIPGMVKGLSGAKTYNCGECGILASRDAESQMNLNKMVSAIVDKQFSDLESYTNFVENASLFVQEYENTKKLCFVINFGLNDYFMGHRVDDSANPYNEETYAGALSTAIRRLQEEYPMAQIVVMTPTYIDIYEAGTEQMSEAGGVLEEYVQAAIHVANEMGAASKNNYVDLQISGENSSEYLLDGCHLNADGRLLYAQQFIEFLVECARQ